MLVLNEEQGIEVQINIDIDKKSIINGNDQIVIDNISRSDINLTNNIDKNNDQNKLILNLKGNNE